VEAGAGKSLREALGEALHASLADLAQPSAGRRLLKALKTALSYKASYDANGTWNFGLDLSGVSGGGADTGVLETDLRKLIHDLAGAAEEEGVGLAILIDEAQDLEPSERVAICAIAHAAAQDDWPVLFALAGLPSLPRVLAEAKSYAERFNYEKIEELRGAIASDALTKPSAEDGVAWEKAAVKLIVDESGGYPYFLQHLAKTPGTRPPGRPLPTTMPGLARPMGRRPSIADSFEPAGTVRPEPNKITCAPWLKTETRGAPLAKSLPGLVAVPRVSAQSGQT
jgi:hypothetical protein